MSNWSVDKIICVGMVFMGAVSVIGYYACMWLGLSPTIEPTISIITGLFGVIGVTTGKNLAQPSQSKTGETLEKVAKTATEAKKAVEAVENIKDIVKK